MAGCRENMKILYTRTHFSGCGELENCKHFHMEWNEKEKKNNDN